jgi:hypothetical protein
MTYIQQPRIGSQLVQPVLVSENATSLATRLSSDPRAKRDWRARSRPRRRLRAVLDCARACRVLRDISKRTARGFVHRDLKVLELRAPDHRIVGRFDERGQDAKCCRADNKTAPKPSPSEKPEPAVERQKPLWLCGLDGGRWRTRTSEPRACEADPAVDWKGLHGTFPRNRGLGRTFGDWLGPTTAPKPSPELTP